MNRQWCAPPRVRGVVGVACVLSIAGCAASEEELGAQGSGGAAGVAVAAVTLVPDAVQCISVTLEAPSSAGPVDRAPLRMDFPVTSGGATTLQLGPLAPGPLRVTGAAYEASCDGLEPATQPAWVGDPVTVTIAPGRVANIALALRRNVGQRTTVDFVDDPTSVSAGGNTTAALYLDGHVRIWGYNPTTMANSLRPTATTSDSFILGGVASVSLGLGYLCLLDAFGVGCAGVNDVGQLGGGPIGSASPLRRVALPGGASATQLAAGPYHACALTDRNTVACWGRNNVGQVTPGAPSSAAMLAAPPTVVTLVGAATPVAAVGVGVGNEFSCAITPSGRVQCWGSNAYRQLGSVLSTDAAATPAVAAVTALAVGGAHACALLADATVRCWGYNADGELGDGTTRNSAAPVDVGLSGVAALAAGSVHTCALLRDGTVSCWGANGAGQLGLGTVAAAGRPAQVPGLSGVASLVAGGQHTCAMLRDGTLRCWGNNANGQVGDGTIASRFVPTAVSW